VGGAERVVFTLRALGETGKPARRSQGFDPVPPPGENLVRIGLMTYVPDQAITRRVEDMMQGDGEFDDPETRAQMTARYSNGGNGFGSELVGDLPEVVDVAESKVFGGSDVIQHIASKSPRRCLSDKIERLSSRHPRLG